MAKQRKTPAAPLKTSVTSSAASSTTSSRESSPERPMKPFRFFDLPSELRIRIYEELLSVGDTIDLNPLNYRYILPRLTLFLVSHRMHDEAYSVFYAQSIRLFPTHDRFHRTKKPLLARLPLRYREAINKLEFRVGPDWTAPPRCQNTGPALGLSDCTNLRTLKIFVEIDPSDNFFAGFRGANATEETYKWFCVDILRSIQEQVPSLETVEIDAYPSVKRDTPLVAALRRTISEGGQKLVWGPLRGWEQEADEPGIIGLEAALGSMTLGRNIATKTIVAQA